MNLKDKIKTYHVISHTHWDREWYEPFEKFRVRLVRLIDNLLELVEKKTAYIFHLDAQTIVLEDYLEIKPQNRNRLKKAIGDGNILIGPWYVQNDLFLTGGEATIRNLMIGRRLIGEFGGTDKMVAYTPDHFGQPSQLPQLARGFNLDSVVFGRGRICTLENGKKSEFIWQGADGSKILAIQMVNFYNNAQRFSSDLKKAVGFFDLARKKLEPLTATNQYLLMNGVDHLEAQENLLEILPELQRSLGDNGTAVKQSTLYDYCTEVRKNLSDPDTQSGEMRDGSDRWIVQGTLSSRVYLKVLNIRCENFLARRLEVLNSMLSMLPFGADVYDRDMLDYLWKLLIQNHPHDSICGCSCDAVHHHMEDRFARLMEAGEFLFEEKLRLLGSHLQRNGESGGDYYVLAVNTLPFERKNVIEAVVDIKAEEKVKSFRLLDENGKEINYSLAGHELTERSLRSPINLPGRMLVDRYKIRFTGTLPAMGYRVFTVKPGKRIPAKPNMDFENEFLKVKINKDGNINLTDKSSGRQFNDILYLEDTADYGDSYTYRPDPQSKVFSTHGLIPEIAMVANNEMETVSRIRYEMPLPPDADFEKRRRSSELVPIPVEITLMLRKNSPYLEVSFKIDNRAKDHCLRAIVRTGIRSDVTQASSMFDVVERNKFTVRPKPEDDRQEPAFEFVKIQNSEQGGMAILVEGLHAYENYRERDGEIGITLLRSTSYISGYHERPLEETWTAPENQCLRTFESRLAIMPGSFNESSETEAMEAVSFLNPPLTYSDSWDVRRFSGGRPCVQDSELSEIFYRPDPYENMELPHRLALCKVDAPAMVMTAMKQSVDGRGLVLRIYNVSNQSKSGKISFGIGISKVDKCRLDETVKEELTVTDSTVTVTAGPKEIITLKIQMEEK